MKNKYLTRTWQINYRVRKVFKILNASSLIKIDVFFRDKVKGNASAKKINENLATPYKKDEVNDKILHLELFINGKYSSYGDHYSNSVVMRELTLDDFYIFSNYIASENLLNLFNLVKIDNDIVFCSSIPDEDCCFNVSTLDRNAGDINDGLDTTIEFYNDTTIFSLSEYEYKSAEYHDIEMLSNFITWSDYTSDTNNLVIKIDNRTNTDSKFDIIVKVSGQNICFVDFISVSRAQIITNSIFSKFSVYSYTNDLGYKCYDIVYPSLISSNIKIGVSSNFSRFGKIEFINEQYDNSTKTNVNVINTFYNSIKDSSTADRILTLKDGIINKILPKNLRTILNIRNNKYSDSRVCKITLSGDYQPQSIIGSYSELGKGCFFVINFYRNTITYGDCELLIYSSNRNVYDTFKVYFSKNNTDLYIKYKDINTAIMQLYYSVDNITTITKEELNELISTEQVTEVSKHPLFKPTTNVAKFSDLAKLNTSMLYKGYPVFCSDKQAPESSSLGLMVYYKDNNWIDALGRIVDENYPTLTKGTTEQRPSNVSEGFEYYDSTIKKKIIWNGAAWVNTDGTELS